MKHTPTTLPGDMYLRLLRSCGSLSGAALLGLALLAFVGLAHPASPTQPVFGADQGEAAPQTPHGLDIMPLDEIRNGMKGYGLTVFQGATIEPFSVEVLSVAHNYGPQRSVIWIHSDDPRMLESGPVQGMSGSPIYLWDEGEEGEPGDGSGRLIGAFAYGFVMAKGCIVGVQPIEYMIDVGERANEDVTARLNADPPLSTGGNVEAAKRSLNQLAQMAGRYAGQKPDPAPRLDAFRALLEPTTLKQELENDGQPDAAVRVPQVAAIPSHPLPTAPAGKRGEGQVMPMLLPMSVGSSELAELAGPLLEPMGIAPVAGGQGMAAGLAAGLAPHGLDREALGFEAGSVVAIPLAFGDLDLSAAGTVTEVLDDGTVLALGHAMFGEGPVALPMATGHVHFIVPRINISFKLSGSLDIKGSLVRDEIAAVVGRNDVEAFTTAPVRVNVEMPGHDARTFNYQVVDHQQLTPILATIVTLRSIEAMHQPPSETTLSLQGQMRFSGGHTVELNTMMPGEQMFGAMSELMPPLSLAMQNPHEGLKLESMDITARITPGRRTAEIINAQLDRAEVAPGERVGVTIWVQPYKQAPKRLRTELEIPAHVPEGDYPLVISDSRTYLSQLMAMRPHLFTTRNVNELTQMIQRVMSVRRDALYLTMRMPEEGIAVGRQELSQLPTSRRAMIFTPTSTVARPYMEMLEHTLDTDLSVSGQLGFTIHVRERGARTQPAPGQRAP